MYKRVTACLLTLMMIVSLAACKAETEKLQETAVEITAEATTEPNTEPTFETGPGVAYNIFEEPNDNEDVTSATSPAEEKGEKEDPTPTEAVEDEDTAAENEAKNEKTEDPTESTTSATEATTEASAEATTEKVVQELTEYEKYLNMSGDEQTQFINSFDSPMAFFEWLNNAKAEHEALKPDIVIDGNTITIG